MRPSRSGGRVPFGTNGDPPPPPPDPPSAPTLTAEWGSGFTQDAALLSATNEGQTTTRFYMSVDEASYTLQIIRNAPLFSYIETGLAGTGTTYDFYCVGANAGGDSPDSNVVRLLDADA